MAAITAPVIYPNPNSNPNALQSRINGAKSRGPVTEEGKAKSSQNARKHRLTAKHSLVDPEHASEYLQHHNSMPADLNPQGPVEEMLADQVVKASWKLRQAHNIETDLMRDNLEIGDDIHSAFTQQELSLVRLSRYQTAIERSMYRALSELRKRQSERSSAPRRQTTQSAEFKTNPESESSQPQNEPGRPTLEMIRAEMKRRGLTSSDLPASPNATHTEEQTARPEERQAQVFKMNPEFEPESQKNDPDGKGQRSNGRSGSPVMRA